MRFRVSIPPGLVGGVLLVGLLAGCGGGDEEIRVYRVSYPEDRPAEAETPSPASPATAPAPSAPPGGPMTGGGSPGMTPLPGMNEAAAAIPTPDWSVPQAWEELPPTPIRKGNFRIVDGDRSAEITVTAFPGDVGGLEANVNRWRRQIGLAPASGEAFAATIDEIKVDGEEAFLVDLVNPSAPDAAGILGAVVPRGEARTWFVKMTGTSSLLDEQRDALRSFLGSLSF
jgi:hypothetical protein